MFVFGNSLHITRGNHGDLGTADGPAEVMKAVRREVDSGVDVLKMFGSTGSGQDVTGLQTFTYEEMKAGVDTAHALDKRIAIRRRADGLRHSISFRFFYDVTQIRRTGVSSELAFENGRRVGGN